MKNIDYIIKYLSDDLDSEEIKEFNRKVHSNDEFKKEFNTVNNLWKAIETKLLINNKNQELCKEELIAEVMSSVDLELYQRVSLSPKEKELLNEINSIIEERASPISKNISNSSSTLSIKKSGTTKNTKHEMAVENSNNKILKSRKRKIRMIFWTAASVAAVVSMLLYIGGWTYSVDKLYDKYYQPTKESFLTGEVRSHSTGRYAKGYFYFMEEDFPNARRVIEKQSKETAYSNHQQLLYALSCFETGDQKLAISMLKETANSTNPAISNFSKWYLSLCLIETMQTEEALIVLKELDKQSSYYAKARKFIHVIERNTDR